MSHLCFISFARIFMSLRECLVQDRSQEISEQAIADLNACLEQLLERCRMIESNIDACTRQAQQIAGRASSEGPAFRARSMQMIRQCLLDRRQHRLEYDRASRSAFMLRKQIGSILNSHVDTAIINAMRQYSAAASKLGLPDKTSEVQRLTDELSECIEQSNTLQDALGEVSSTFSCGVRGDGLLLDADADLEAELESILSSNNDINSQSDRVVINVSDVIPVVDLNGADENASISATEERKYNKDNAYPPVENELPHPISTGLRQRVVIQPHSVAEEEHVNNNTSISVQDLLLPAQ